MTRGGEDRTVRWVSEHPEPEDATRGGQPELVLPDVYLIDGVDVSVFDTDVDAAVRVDSAPPTVGAERCDVALLVPSWSAANDWIGRKILYVPQRPRGTDAGARVWVCRDRNLFYSYRIDGFFELAGRIPGDHENEGWAAKVTDGRPERRSLESIPDPSGVATTWLQGFRYLRPDAAEFVRAPRYRAEIGPDELRPVPVAAVEEAPPATDKPRRSRFLFGRRRRDGDTE